MEKVFVYGTLREGGGNTWLTETADRVVNGCYAFGKMWNCRGNSPIFPFTRFGEGERVWGDLIYTDDVEAYEGAWRMEINVGYEARSVPVFTPADGIIVATAFHWPESRHGIEVPGQDWVAWIHAARRPFGEVSPTTVTGDAMLTTKYRREADG